MESLVGARRKPYTGVSLKLLFSGDNAAQAKRGGNESVFFKTAQVLLYHIVD